MKIASDLAGVGQRLVCESMILSDRFLYVLRVFPKNYLEDETVTGDLLDIEMLRE